MLVSLALLVLGSALFLSLVLRRGVGKTLRIPCAASPAARMPGPWALPGLGNLLDLGRRDLPEHLNRLARRYGDIYRLRSGNTDIVVLNSTELIREALLKKWSDFAGRPHSYTAECISFGGKDLSLGDYSPLWRAQRRLVHGALQRCRATNLESVVTREARQLSQELSRYAGRAVDLSCDFSMCSCNIICTLTFGTRFEKEDSEFVGIHACLNEIVALWGSPLINALDSFPLLRKLPNPAFSRLLHAVSRRDEIVSNHTQQHKDRAGYDDAADITDALLQSLSQPAEVMESQERVTEQHIHMSIVDLFIGGTETTAAWLCWAIAFLLHRPEVQEQVYSELCDVLGSQRYPLYSDRDRLPFLTATINEVLRLRPVAPLAVPHRATRDSSIAGYFIPKDTVVIPNLYAAHHHPREWTDPHSFRPERFVSSLAPRVPLQCLLPFGVGARLCLGEAVARMELFLFTAHLLRDFKFLPPHGQGPPDLTGQAGIVLKARPFLVRALPRPGLPV
ncbi:steroid 21-hydroxylase-like isoform X2 [Acipenser ruthenus]|uniref:steroid 21-hydroxylase-like isoform X2 n=1 Tax=Acipenser ruthenus TaxID=7906 RepID=UPI0027406121|nr:steroid 21-hydroxylase-like isoform X2 [Acipenser ruthenus]